MLFHLARSLSMKSLLLELNLTSESIPVIETYVFCVKLALARSLSIKSTFWSLKLSSGSTPVDESNVFGCSEEFKRRGPGAHLIASIHKSIESNEEMNEFRKGRN